MDISTKIYSFQCSSVKKRHDQNSHDWKLIPMHFTNNAFRKHFIFHLNLSFKTSVLHHFPTFYVNILPSWKRNFSHVSYTPKDPNFYGSTIILQLITILFSLKNFQITILALSISYLHLREDLKARIASKENFNSPIVYITNLHKFHRQFLKSGSKYWEKTAPKLVFYS